MVIFDRLADLFLRVHDERAVGEDRLSERYAGHELEAEVGTKLIQSAGDSFPGGLDGLLHRQLLAFGPCVSEG